MKFSPAKRFYLMSMKFLFPARFSAYTANGLLHTLHAKQKQPGQVLLLIVLVITVAITISLSIATRSIINLRLATEEDQSQRAFSAAEAGIERSLSSNTAVPNGTFNNSSSFSTAITTVRGTNFLLHNGRVILKDEGADVWLSTYSQNQGQNYTNPWTGQLTIYWGSLSDTCNSAETTNTMAAIEVILISGNRNNPVSTHHVFDPCGSRRAVNNFSTPLAGGTINNKTFAYSARINVATNGLIARVIPLYANSYIGVVGAPVLPDQGVVVESTGVSGDIKRKISVLREHPQLPIEFFSYTFLWPK